MALLKKNIRFKISNSSKSEEQITCSFYAKVDSNCPEDMEIGRNVLDKEAYKQHREEAMRDQNIFESEAYAFQDTLIAGNKIEI